MKLKIRTFPAGILGGMKAPSTAHGLSPLELRQKISVREAAELNGVSEDTFKRAYRHLIRKIGPRRLAVELGDALELPPARAPP
jgi:hypothetical protein